MYQIESSESELDKTEESEGVTCLFPTDFGGTVVLVATAGVCGLTSAVGL